MTISRCSALTSQPVRTNSVASQSSSSGWLGDSPCDAEVFARLDEAGAEVHLPEAVDRHARGQRVAGSTSQRARPRRLAARLRAAAAARPARRARPSRPACRSRPRTRTNVSRGFGISSMTIAVGIDLLQFRTFRAQLPRFRERRCASPPERRMSGSSRAASCASSRVRLPVHAGQRWRAHGSAAPAARLRRR